MIKYTRLTRHNAVTFMDIHSKNNSHFTRKLVAIPTVEREEGCELDGTFLFMERIMCLFLVAWGKELISKLIN